MTEEERRGQSTRDVVGELVIGAFDRVGEQRLCQIAGFGGLLGERVDL